MEQSIFFGLQKEVVLAGATGLFLLLSLLMFVRGVLNGSSRPYLWAWVIRAGICGVAFTTQILQGATYSLALAGGQLVAVGIIILCILARQPRRGRLDRADWWALGAAGCGVAWWVVSGDPLYGLFGALLADASATAMGIRAAVRRGTAEPMAFWVCSLSAATMAVLAAGTTAWGILLAPLFSCANALANILTIAYVRRVRRRKTLMPVVIVEPAGLG